MSSTPLISEDASVEKTASSIDILTALALLLTLGYVVCATWHSMQHRSRFQHSLAMKQAEYIVGHTGLWEEDLPDDENEYLMIAQDTFERMTNLFSRKRTRNR